MSQSFRPVKETWFPHSSQFIDRDALLAILERIALDISSAYEETEYGEVTVFYVSNGADFLRFIEKDEDFNVAYLGHDIEVEADDLQSLLSNMKGLLVEWRKAIDETGALRFYLD
jgi:hypothetical protein